MTDSVRAAAPGPLHPKYVKSERLGRRIMEYRAWLNAGEYKWLMLVREFDAEGLWQHEGVRSCAHWLNWKCGIGLNAAREKVRVAHALPKLPKLSRRYSRGEISYSKVRAITRIATPENEDYLLMIARHGTAAHVEGLVSKYRRCKRLEDRKNARRQHASRELKWFYDDDGSLVIRGRFPAEQGALVLKALKLATERRDREIEAERKHLREAAKAESVTAEAEARVSAETPAEYGVSAETPSHGLVRARIVQRRLQRDPASAVRPSEPVSVRQADALHEMAESYLAHGLESRSTADRYQVVIHVSAETLKAEAPGDSPPADGVSAATAGLAAGGFSWIENGPHVSAETAQRAACDGSLVRVLGNGHGEPLNIGRKRRSIPPALRRALQMRDDGCQFPGCTHQQSIDGHHIKHWADGGETSLWNLVGLCPFHHWLVHEGGFGCERRPDGRIVFTNPFGDEIPGSVSLPAVSPDAPVDWLKADLSPLEIDSDTGACRWQGEKIDWPLAVGHLFDKRPPHGAAAAS